MGRDTMYEQVNKSTHVQCHVYATRTTKCNHKTLVQLTVITVQYTLYVQTLRDTHYTWKRAVLARLHSTQSCLPYAIINSLSFKPVCAHTKPFQFNETKVHYKIECARVAGQELSYYDESWTLLRTQD